MRRVFALPVFTGRRRGVTLTMERRVDLVARLRGILFRPAATWQEVAEEPIDVGRFYLRYIMPLVAISPLCKLIGWSLFGYIPAGPGLFAALLGYILDLIAVVLLAQIAGRLAPAFQGDENFPRALKLIAYAATPSWLGGVFRLVPALGLLSLLLSLYSAYVLYLGVTPLLAVPKDSAVGYTAILLAAILAAFILIGSVIGLVAGAALIGLT